MKILHTSDWHLGHTLYNYDRSEEQMSMLTQITDIVRIEKPDLFLLSGDVYHTPQPAAYVQMMFTNALVNIHDANPEMTIVITAGNHDSGTKHEIFRTPWKALKVHTIGKTPSRVIRCEDEAQSCINMWYEDYVIEIPGKGFVIAIPYAYERNIPDGFFQQLLDAVNLRNYEAKPVIMMAHTTVKGCDFSGHERGSEYVVGGIDSYDIKEMGQGYDYLALGHIHHEQFIHTGNHNVRYCGSPLAVSFDEKYPHSISIVEIDKHGSKPEVRKIEINNPRPLVTLPTDGTTSWENAKEMLANYPANISSYIRLNVEIDNILPSEAYAEAAKIAEGKQCRFCIINTKRREIQTTGSKTLTVQEFQQERPFDIAKRYAEDLGVTFDDDMKELFNLTLEMVNEEERN